MNNSDQEDRLGRWLLRADQGLKPIEYGLTLFGGIIVFGLMFLGMLQIVLRTIFRSPIFGYIDVVEFSMIGFGVLAISYVQRAGGHVRMEMVVGKLRGRALWIAEAFGSLIGIVIVGILIPYAYFHFERAFNFGDSTIDIELPTWPGKLAVPIALGILLIRLLIQFVGYLRLVRHPDAKPIAVIVMKSVEEQASDEIKGAS